MVKYSQMAKKMTNFCPICSQPLESMQSIGPLGQQIQVVCPLCKKYKLSDLALNMLQETKPGMKEVSKLHYALYRMHNKEDNPYLDRNTLTILLENDLPKPKEQADNLIYWLGNELKEMPGSRKQIHYNEVKRIIGSITAQDVGYICKSLADEGFIPLEGLSLQTSFVNLTFKGWERYDELTRQVTESKLAFMAMPFGFEDLNNMYSEYFKPAVTQTGFELRRLDENPTAGLIDNRLRVEIRKARFLIAELTNNNCGAYWEAGFAEGLGKPVIYTCEATHFESRKTHFDTNHCHTVVWSKDNPLKGAEDLKATIRATLPDEAVLTDD